MVFLFDPLPRQVLRQLTLNQHADFHPRKLCSSQYV
mgnify:CR=1 FL=1